MKYTFLMTALFAVASPAVAGFSENGTASAARETHNISRVGDLHNMRDEQRATLEGHIVRQVRHEHYVFRDASGSIEVEIDDDEWGGLDVTPANRVYLEVEVDRKRNGIEVDVKSIRLAN